MSRRPTGCCIANHEPPGARDRRFRTRVHPFAICYLHVMKNRFSRCLILTAVISLAWPVYSGQRPSQAEMAQLVAQAATYQPGESRAALRRIEELVGQATVDSGTRKAVEAGLIQLLGSSSTFEARRFACKQLGITGSKSALPVLAGLLQRDQNASLACLALTTYPPGKADELLRGALDAAPPLARVQILNTLGDRRDEESVKPLRRWAANADRAVAEAAIASLGKIGDNAAWETLAALRRTAAPELGSTITEACLRCAANLAAAGNHKIARMAYDQLLAGSEPTYVRRAALAGLLRLDKDGDEERILSVLRGSDSALQPVAIAAVVALRSKGASEKFAAELPRLGPQEQIWMIESLAVRNDAASRAAIAKSLGATEVGVRLAAISALGRIGDTSSVELLGRALASTNETEERRSIELALIDLASGTRTDNAMIDELRRASGSARVTLIRALVRRQGSAANPVLLEEVNNSDPAVAQAAFRALSKTAVAADVPALLKQLNRVIDADVRAEAESAAGQALGKIDEATGRSQAIFDAARLAPGVDARISFVGLLPRCGDAEALKALVAAERNPDARVRDVAVRALAAWPDMAAWDVLMDHYRQGATETVRGLALQGLVRLAGEENSRPDAKLVERYRQLIDGARGEADLRLVLGGLGGVADAGALELALPLLANASIRPEAEASVKRIAEAIKAKDPKAAHEALQKLQPK